MNPSDPYGYIITVGKLVAFNYQGQLRKGEVESVTFNERSGRWTITVREHVMQTISKIKSPLNLVVLFEP